jgi:hypothetical protein
VRMADTQGSRAANRLRSIALVCRVPVDIHQTVASLSQSGCRTRGGGEPPAMQLV